MDNNTDAVPPIGLADKFKAVDPILPVAYAGVPVHVGPVMPPSVSAALEFSNVINVVRPVVKLGMTAGARAVAYEEMPPMAVLSASLRGTCCAARKPVPEPVAACQRSTA